MSESPALPVLFTQLQARYPTSGLLTELVQMDADRYVVRALVQLGSMTLATSMATAATVEQAEDQARLRVLALLGIHAASLFSVPDIGMPDISFASQSTPLQTLTTTLQNTARVGETLNDVAFQDIAPTLSSVPEVEPIAPSLTFPLLAVEPNAMITPTPVAAVEPYPTAPAVTEPEPEMFDEPPDMDMDDVSYNAATYAEEPFESHTLPVEEASDDRATADITAAAEPVAKSKPRKPGADKMPAAAIDAPDQPSTDSASSGSASRDLSSLISQIGVEIDRIGWSKRQGSTYLQKTYGKKTRSELTDDELEDFLTYLNTQPSAGGVGSEE